MSKSRKRSPGAPAARAARAAEVYYTDQAKEDIAWWRAQEPRIAARIEALIADVRRSPFQGIGKPEPLKYQQGGYWSRRITGEHRLVYRVAGGVIYIAQARYHYSRR